MDAQVPAVHKRHKSRSAIKHIRNRRNRRERKRQEKALTELKDINNLDLVTVPPSLPPAHLSTDSPTNVELPSTERVSPLVPTFACASTQTELSFSSILTERIFPDSPLSTSSISAPSYSPVYSPEQLALLFQHILL